jgi:two-component system OmpR family response regulator
MRRTSATKSAVFSREGVSYDSRNGRVTLNHMPVNLTAQEVAVLAYLFHHANRHVTQTELSEHIYEYDDDRDSNTIAVFITRLRKKLGADLIETERGRGYMIKLAA